MMARLCPTLARIAPTRTSFANSCARSRKPGVCELMEDDFRLRVADKGESSCVAGSPIRIGPQTRPRLPEIPTSFSCAWRRGSRYPKTRQAFHNALRRDCLLDRRRHHISPPGKSYSLRTSSAGSSKIRIHLKRLAHQFSRISNISQRFHAPMRNHARGGGRLRPGAAKQVFGGRAAGDVSHSPDFNCPVRFLRLRDERSQLDAPDRPLAGDARKMTVAGSLPRRRARAWS